MEIKHKIIPIHPLQLQISTATKARNLFKTTLWFFKQNKTKRRFTWKRIRSNEIKDPTIEKGVSREKQGDQTSRKQEQPAREILVVYQPAARACAVESNWGDKEAEVSYKRVDSREQWSGE